jgi:hypothetical protein
MYLCQRVRRPIAGEKNISLVQPWPPRSFAALSNGQRNEALDVFRGVAIIAVILYHPERVFDHIWTLCVEEPGIALRHRIEKKRIPSGLLAPH